MGKSFVESQKGLLYARRFPGDTVFGRDSFNGVDVYSKRQRFQDFPLYRHYGGKHFSRFDKFCRYRRLLNEFLLEKL